MNHGCYSGGHDKQGLINFIVGQRRFLSEIESLLVQNNVASSTSHVMSQDKSNFVPPLPTNLIQANVVDPTPTQLRSSNLLRRDNRLSTSQYNARLSS